MRTTLVILIAFSSGLIGGYALRGVPLWSVHAEGHLLFEEPQDPAATPTYPPGYYVLSRVYVPNAPEAMLGKRIYLTGSLSTRAHPETHSYPAIRSRDLPASVP
jgi:hypothetical protein